MASGKLTPRQKMINMMYLVLTALLALNVSVEVLEAFVTIDKGLERNITIAKDKNKSLLGDLDIAYGENPQKVEPWRNKAIEVNQTADQLFKEMQNLKLEIVRDGKKEDEEHIAISNGVVNPELIEDLGNTNISSRVMVGDHNGASYELRKKIETFKNYLAGVVETSPILQQSIKDILATEDPIDPKTGLRSQGNSWETANFYGVPLISAVAILSKMQLDVLNCESEVLTYLKHQVGASDFKFSNIDVAVVPVSQYITKGGEYNAEIFLAAYDPTVQPILTIGGRDYQAGSNGKISFSAGANSVGEVRTTGTIKFKGPDGDTELPVPIHYFVVEPMAVVSATKMNVFYRGVENPVSLMAAGAQMDKIEARISTGHTITRKGNEFIVRPGAGNTCDITILVDGKPMGPPTKFRVKDVPTPIPSLDGITGTTASKGELVSSQGVLAKMPPDFDFDLKFAVTSFTVSATVGAYTSDEVSNSPYFTDKQKQLFNNMKSGQRVYIMDIKAKMLPDGKTFELPPLAIKIR